MVVLYILIALLMFGVLIFIHEFGHFIAARATGVGVKEFAVGMGPKLASWKSKKYDTIYTIRLLPIGGFNSLVGEDESSDDPTAFCNKSIWKRMFIVVTGPLLNILLGFLVMILLVSTGGPLASNMIAEFEDGALSEEQGLMVGDRIVKVGDVKTRSGNELVYEILYNGIEPIDIVVERNGEEIVFEDFRFPTMESEGITFGNYDFYVYAEQKSFGTMMKQAFFRSLSSIKMVFDSLFGLFNGRLGLSAMSGPVGVTEAIGDAAKAGYDSFLNMFVLITINLGVFNLLPFPALDGGRFLFLLIEAIIRKPVNRKIEGYVNYVGLIILLALMAIVTLKDIIKLF